MQNDTPLFSPHILVIDDEDIYLELIGIHLTKQGYRVTLRENGLLGLDYLLEYPSSVDLLLLDLMMPDLNGVEVLRVLKTHPILKNIKVLLQTGLVDHDIFTQALALGVCGYLHKPYKKEKLLHTISQMLAL